MMTKLITHASQPDKRQRQAPEQPVRDERRKIEDPDGNPRTDRDHQTDRIPSPEPAPDSVGEPPEVPARPGKSAKFKATPSGKLKWNRQRRSAFYQQS
jgi:hypothetical protein